MITDRIQAYLNTDGKPIPEALLAEVGKLASYSFSRQFGVREDRPGTIRLSSVGKCMRAQAYKLLNFPENGKRLDARAKMVFFQGDIAELAIIQLAKAAGCDIQACGLDQETITLEGIEGRPDGILTDNNRKYLVEVKSMPSFRFKDFERGNIDEGYIWQIQAYLAALGLSEAILVALNKDAGVICEKTILKDEKIVAEIKARIAVLKKVKKESLPDRGHSPNDKGFYPFNCLYCGYHGTCLPNAEKVVVKDAYKLKERTNETPSKKH